MKYLISLCLVSCFLSACAGNPPAWWNPNNRYGTAENQPARKTTAKKQAVVREETMDVFTEVSYEEEILAPLPEEEEPAASTEAPAPSPAQNPGKLPAPSVLE